MISADEIANLERQTLAMLDRAECALADSAAGRDVTLRRRWRALPRVRLSLMRPTVFALVGEFNSGKSSLCNALMELDTLPTDLFATTSVPTRLYWSSDVEMTYSTSSGRDLPPTLSLAEIDEPLSRIDIGAPADVLSSIELVDMPGLANPEAERSNIDLSSIRFDALIWCTPITQAWKETEQMVWSRLPVPLQQRTILALTFADLVTAGEGERVRERLSREAGPFASIVAVSAVSGHAAGPADLLAACRELADELKLDRLLKAARIMRRFLAAL